jgi:FKBP-type peptidyl-prolyl cis-trans isomerase
VGQYKKDTTEIGNYLRNYSVHATKLSSGVWFINDAPVSGIRATYNDSIYLTYQMKLLTGNGPPIDESNGPTLFQLSGLIAGIQIAMPQFQLGSAGRIFIPSYFAYQNQSTSVLPANSNLIFQFTLNDVKDYRLKKDTATINKYLKAHSIVNPIIDPSGLRYTIDVVGSGIKPLLTDSVVVTYSSKFLSSGEEIEQSTPHKILVSDWLIGLSAGILNLKEGSTATFYLPSSLGYGPVYNSRLFIAANSNLIYNVQLTKVIHH